MSGLVGISGLSSAMPMFVEKSLREGWHGWLLPLDDLADACDVL